VLQIHRSQGAIDIFITLSIFYFLLIFQFFFDILLFKMEKHKLERKQKTLRQSARELKDEHERHARRCAHWCNFPV
jgi:hypothetical protein